jgi:GNAT superfamily N-acetyltransferase
MNGARTQTSAGVAVRPAEGRDAEAVHALLGELGYDGLDVARFASSFARLAEATPPHVWVAHFGLEGVAVGVMSLSWAEQLRLGGIVVSIDELVVTESARGRGAGAALLARAKDVVRELRAVRLELHTRRSRESYARGFYVKNGFVEVDSAVMRLELG